MCYVMLSPFVWRRWCYAFFVVTFLVSFVIPTTAFESKDTLSPLVFDDKDSDDDGYKQLALLMRVLQLVRENYVDKERTSYSRLVKGALKGMLHELDPFSVYETKDRYKKTVEDSNGAFGGIGVVVMVRNNALEIVAPIEDTPGAKVGLHAGDHIIKIAGKSTRNMTLRECIDMIKGKPGTEVVLTIYRSSGDITRDFTIKREVIKVSPVKGVGIIDNGIGYIRLTQFSAPAAERFDKALEKLEHDGMKALIIDLRGNPGGLVTAAVDICSRFLEEGKLIVFTRGRIDSSNIDYKAKACKQFLDIPIAVLVDGNSASASEIVAGCLKDHNRAVLVGAQTFGKGSVQSVVPINDGEAVRLTTAKYYTPGRQVIHGKGITPDILVPLAPAFKRKLAGQRARYPGVIKPDVPDAVKDYQLQRAVDVLKGINLFNISAGQDE